MTIIVGYIPTPQGQAALKRAVAEAKLREQRLVVVNASRGDAFADARLLTEDDLIALEKHLQDSGIVYDSRQYVRGSDPAEELVKAAEDEGADLIVIGMRERTPVGKLIMGSTAQRVLLDSPCPVLAVKAERE